jgi:hypothetical protein
MRHVSTSKHPSRPWLLRNTAAVQYSKENHVHISQIENRMKQWHAQLGDNSKIQIRSLPRYVN